MKPVYLSIQPKATGRRIRQLLDINGYTVRDIQEAFGFEYPQAIYHWLSGRSLPSLDNLVILGRLLHTTIDEILVISETENRCYSGSGSIAPGASSVYTDHAAYFLSEIMPIAGLIVMIGVTAAGGVIPHV